MQIIKDAMFGAFLGVGAWLGVHAVELSYGASDKTPITTGMIIGAVAVVASRRI